MKIKQLFIAAALVAVTTAALAQPAAGYGPYHSDPLVQTNTYLNIFPTNLVPAAFAVSSNPNIPVPGLGLFSVNLSQSDPNFAAQGGVCYQLIYDETSLTNANQTPIVGGQNTNLVATFMLVLDDATLKDLAQGMFSNSIASGTNIPTYTVTFNLNANATNSITNAQWAVAMAQGPQTNTLGAKWAKLIGFSSAGNTNGLVIRSLRAGYPQ